MRDRLINKLRAASTHANIRLRLRAVLRVGALGLPLPLIYALAALAYIKVTQPGAAVQQRLVLWGCALLGLWLSASLVPLFVRRGKLRGAMELDRHHGLKDRVSNALAFASLERRTPLMEAAIDDALVHADGLRPSKAVPLRWPREFFVSVGLAALVYGVSLLEVRTERVEQIGVESLAPMALNTDDVELLREWTRELEKTTQDPGVAAAVRRFNQLVEDIAERRLDRRQIFERIEELEQSLNPGADAEDSALAEGLEGLARELHKSGSTKPIAEALEQRNLADAEKAIEELAKRLKEKPTKVNRAEIERIRKALEEASKQSAERVANIERERREVEASQRRLLDKKKNGEKLSRDEQQKLERRERQLERLDRQKKRAEQTKGEMSQLDRELAEAARQLMEEMGGNPSESLEAAAEDINRMAQKELTRQEKEALKKQLEELRELLRQQKKSGKGRDERLERFRQMARGQKPGDGKDGQGEGQGQKRGPARLSLGNGAGQGAAEIPMPGAGQGQGQGQGQEPGKDGQQGTGPGGEQWGSGSTDDIKGDPTKLDGQTEDVSAAGIDSGEGEASVEVVYGAAERGFVGRGYKKVYTDYKTVAEEVLEKDEIPPGYKFYVRRYFQLIRPRE